MRNFSVSLVLAGLFALFGNGLARAHDGDGMVTQAGSFLRMVMALNGGHVYGNSGGRSGSPVMRQPQASLESILARASLRYSIKKSAIKAVIKCESNFDPMAVSPKGARGLMQVMPATAVDLGVNPDHLFDPAVNIDAGTAYLYYLSGRYGGRLHKVAAAYNAGPARVDSRRSLPHETKNYLVCVMRNYRRYEQRREGE